MQIKYLFEIQVKPLKSWITIINESFIKNIASAVLKKDFMEIKEKE